MELPFELTQFIWSFIENETIKQFFDNSKNTRKALETTQLIWKRLGAYVCHLAAENGYLDILKLARQKNCPWNSFTPEFAAKNGHLDIVKWVRSVDPPCRWDEQTPAWAAKNGHLDIVKWVRSVDPPCPWDERTLKYAADGAYLEIVEFCIVNDCPNGWRCYVCDLLNDYQNSQCVSCDSFRT